MPKQIIVIGAGAIGSLVAAQLAQAGHDITLVGRGRAVDSIRQEGLRVDSPDLPPSLIKVPVAGSIARALAAMPRPWLMVLAVKSYDTASALAEVQAATPDPPPILTLQNGVGNEELLAGALGAGQVIAGTITTPVTVLEPGYVVAERSSRHVGVANVAPPAATDRAGEVAAVLASAGFQAQQVQDWRSLKWTKLAMNLLCNASCALLGWSPAEVWSHDDMAMLEVAAWREALSTMQAQGVRLVNLGGYPLGRAQPLLVALPPALLRRVLGRFVAGGRGGKLPSLYIDLDQGRGRTEVDWLNGAVVREAGAAELPVPANLVLWQSLAAVAKGSEPWSRYRNHPEILVERWREVKRQTAG
jgi:2-dehydropantoate 2-reductase